MFMLHVCHLNVVQSSVHTVMSITGCMNCLHNIVAVGIDNE